MEDLAFVKELFGLIDWYVLNEEDRTLEGFGSYILRVAEARKAESEEIARDLGVEEG